MKLNAESRERKQRIALARLLDATDCYEQLAAPHERLFSGRDLRNFEELVAARKQAQEALAAG